jgi:hypothetical protein
MCFPKTNIKESVRNLSLCTLNISKSSWQEISKLAMPNATSQEMAGLAYQDL